MSSLNEFFQQSVNRREFIGLAAGAWALAGSDVSSTQSPDAEPHTLNSPLVINELFEEEQLSDEMYKFIMTNTLRVMGNENFDSANIELAPAFEEHKWKERLMKSYAKGNEFMYRSFVNYYQAQGYNAPFHTDVGSVRFDVDPNLGAFSRVEKKYNPQTGRTDFRYFFGSDALEDEGAHASASLLNISPEQFKNNPYLAGYANEALAKTIEAGTLVVAARLGDVRTMFNPSQEAYDRSLNDMVSFENLSFGPGPDTQTLSILAPKKTNQLLQESPEQNKNMVVFLQWFQDSIASHIAINASYNATEGGPDRDNILPAAVGFATKLHNPEAFLYPDDVIPFFQQSWNEALLGYISNSQEVVSPNQIYSLAIADSALHSLPLTIDNREYIGQVVHLLSMAQAENDHIEIVPHFSDNSSDNTVLSNATMHNLSGETESLYHHVFIRMASDLPASFYFPNYQWGGTLPEDGSTLSFDTRQNATVNGQKIQQDFSHQVILHPTSVPAK